MYNYQIIIEYIGTNFIGWQIQKKGPSIQLLIQKALSKVLKEKIKIILNGAVKRGNLKLINFYSKKLNYWRGFFEKI